MSHESSHLVSEVHSAVEESNRAGIRFENAEECNYVRLTKQSGLRALRRLSVKTLYALIPAPMPNQVGIFINSTPETTAPGDASS
jgi:hypothetical protein